MEIQSSQVGSYFASELNQNKNGQSDEELTQSAGASQAASNNSAADYQPESDNKVLLAQRQANIVDLSNPEQNNLQNQTKVEAQAADTLVNEAEREQMETALAQVSDFVQVQNRQLNFSFDDKSNRSIIKVTDADSGDIIRQIPSEEVLKLAERIKELQNDAGEAIGVLINRQV